MDISKIFLSCLEGAAASGAGKERNEKKQN